MKSFENDLKANTVLLGIALGCFCIEIASRVTPNSC
jgi:hypothetical protein